jgi:hypothetical protein
MISIESMYGGEGYVARELMSRELPSALLKRDAGLLGVCGLLFAASPTRL